MGGGARVITEALRHRPDKPVIAAVNGLAYGGGLELLLACDLAVCAEHATFALPEVTRGLMAAGGGLITLPRVIGPRRALQLILTGAPIDAATALEWGLVNEVVPRATSSRPPLGARPHRRRQRAGRGQGEQADGVGRDDRYRRGRRRHNKAAFAAVRRSPDALEGLRAFAERRPPVWTDMVR